MGLLNRNFVVAMLLAGCAEARIETKQELEQVALGIFDGALEEEHLDDYVTCATVDAPKAAGEIQAAIQELELKTVSGVVKGLKLMSESFQTLSDAVTLCAQDKDTAEVRKIAALLKTFKDPKSMALHIGHDILFNGVDIEKHINAAVAQYKAQNYKEFGVELGNMLSEISIGTELMMVKENPEPEVAGGREAVVAEAAEFASGLLKGAIDAEIVAGSITGCIKDASIIAGDAKGAYNDFKKKDFKDIVDGLRYVGDALMAVRNLEADCHNFFGDFDKLEEISAILANPADLVYEVDKHLIINGVEIKDDVYAGVELYSQNNVYGFGEKVGDALAKLVVGGAQIQEDFDEEVENDDGDYFLY